MTVDPVLPAEVLVGLLADDDRRAVAAALILGASRVADVREATGLDAPRVAKALTRLVDSGLVERAGDGSLHLLGQAFAVAARAAAAARPSGEPEATADMPAETAKVLRSFVRDGRLTRIPTSRSKRLVVLDRLAQDFEPGRRYPERTVNVMLARWHPDTASLRRYLVDEGFLTREAGEYWRTGGSVPVSGS
ncbi:MAG TPA: DUF2087 domain-containing protein [Acidimicrobiales bacterium]|nr:DUF2087 domain-containing protein [Acidimicrobiales bacterium]